jgi:DNA repair photolyase
VHRVQEGAVWVGNGAVYKHSYGYTATMSADRSPPTRGSSNVPFVGRGAGSNVVGRFETTHGEAQDDGWGILDEPLPPLQTTVGIDASRSIITRNSSPDIFFTQSINPYRGCEHGCVYCYARPAHAYLNLSPGLDFETKLFYKPDAVKLLREELAAKNYQCSPIALGANTDPWQPIEREYRITRGILETLSECNHPATIVTKGAAIIERDLDLLASMAERNLVGVMISVTTLNKDLKRKLEPRAASPGARLAIIQKLAEAKVPVGTLVAPVIPVLTDHEAEHILEAVAAAGAKWAGYVMLRLPHEVNPLFQEWLRTHEPLKAEHVMSIVRELRGGKDYDSTFGKRQKGEGVFAQLFKQRFELACRKLGLNKEREWRLDTSKFKPPVLAGRQMSLL